MAPTLMTMLPKLDTWVYPSSNTAAYHVISGDGDVTTDSESADRTSTSLSESDLESGSIDLETEKPLHTARTTPRRIFVILLSYISRCFWLLLPSPLARLLNHGSPTNTDAIPTPNSTSYLNGLRGIASLIVAFQHNTNQYFPFNHHGYGERPGDDHITQLPMIRNILNGSFAVTIFFVISGFALSYGPLKRMHAGRNDDALAGLPSSVFRRPVRLFLPLVPIMFVSMVMVRMGWVYQVNNDGLLSPPPTYWGSLVVLWEELVNTITIAKAPAAIPQVWTLSAEFEGSILVFLLCLALVRTTPLVRIAVTAAVFAWRWYLGKWAQSLFVAGMLLAEARHVREKMPEMGRRTWWVVALTMPVFFTFALWIGGFPIYGDGYKALGFRWMASIPTGRIEANRFWHSVAAILLVSALEHMPWMQRGLNARWVLYLGEISYGLYLVHWTVGMSSFGKGVIISLREGRSELAAWTIGFSYILPTCIWAGDVYWRLVDQKSVSFAKWLSEKCGV